VQRLRKAPLRGQLGLHRLLGNGKVVGVQLNAQAAPARAQAGHQRAAGAHHRVQHRLLFLGEEADEVFGQGLRKLSRVLQHVLAPRRRVVRKPRLLKLKPALAVKVVQFVAGRLSWLGHGVRQGS
jgi:hypothetical protein